ncbi:MAG: DUF5689 domain-containing protein [Vicingaceae bacterium]
MMNIIKTYSAVLVLIALFTSCKKEFDAPTVATVPTGNVKTIAEVRAMYQPGKTLRIREDISVCGVVTMDETTGNLYKESYITDGVDNLYLRFVSNTGLYVGDSVRINLNGALMLKYNQMLQIDSLHPDNSVVKLSTQNFVEPNVVSVSSLLADLEGSQGKLVQIDGAFFAEGGQGLTFADGENLVSESRFLFGLGGDEIEVRTSGYSNFADDTLPSGSGKFIGIAAQYNDGLQLLIRDPQELEMNGDAPVLKTFNDNSTTSGGWNSQVVIGNFAWTTNDQGSSSPYAVITNYDNGNTASEAWLISPAFNLTSSTNPSLSFKNASNYNGPDLEVLVSTNYDGTSNPSTATWTTLSTNLSGGGFEWVSSGVIDLSAFNGANTYVGFKYTGSSSDGKTWELDNIIINK